ncbi:MAG TPA: hypothetical protein VK746_16805 [Candidatus Eisenbacteria bacterium]|jgi:hypothetical protein|nr:hypothetical protein [Candidatus Eisenbacteria bacterium]
MSLIPRVIVRRWLETVLALFSLAFLYCIWYPEYMPRMFRAVMLKEDLNLTLWDWMIGAMGAGLLGILGFSALIVLFFLGYSPIYLVNKLPHLMGKGGWMDRREVRFYLACFALVCLLVVLLTRSFDTAGVMVILLAGFGPMVWRILV